MTIKGTYTVSNGILGRDRVLIVEAPNKIGSVFLEQEFEDSVGVKPVTMVLSLQEFLARSVTLIITYLLILRSNFG